MGFKPGHEKKGGRKPGTKNKRRSIEDVCLEAGLDPFKELAAIAMDQMHERRFDALKELAQYLEPKRKAIELAGDADSPGIKIVIEEFGKK